MKKRRAFTLIELLVVISIIALLMAILMPAMAEIKKRAQAVICKNNLKNLATLASIYTSENDGKFWWGPGVRGPNPPTNRLSTPQTQWYACLGRLATETGDSNGYVDEWEYRCCPVAVKPTAPVGMTQSSPGYALRPEGPDAAIRAWGAFAIDTDNHWEEPNVFGSYGQNSSVGSIPRHATGMSWTQDSLAVIRARKWATDDVRGGDKVPVFMDDTWFMVNADTDNVPPAYEGEPARGFDVEEIKRVCINRHNQAINVSYLDSSVRTTALKQLWMLKWRRTSIIDDANLPDWKTEAPWMLNFRKN